MPPQIPSFPGQTPAVEANLAAETQVVKDMLKTEADNLKCPIFSTPIYEQGSAVHDAEWTVYKKGNDDRDFAGTEPFTRHIETVDERGDFASYMIGAKESLLQIASTFDLGLDSTDRVELDVQQFIHWDGDTGLVSRREFGIGLLVFSNTKTNEELDKLARRLTQAYTEYRNAKERGESPVAMPAEDKRIKWGESQETVINPQKSDKIKWGKRTLKDRVVDALRAAGRAF
ncbi:hypothetical protein DRH14_01315 [Candidatus Shapirobacteria bacterium]|nr:MAG: hypothetical protein DRH14_01315 [Candidatus Shapirobacteria bacterium]